MRLEKFLAESDAIFSHIQKHSKLSEKSKLRLFAIATENWFAIKLKESERNQAKPPKPKQNANNYIR